MTIQYPLQLRFKLVALAPRIFVTDANGQNLFFVSQKVLAFKEDVRIYTDESKTNQVYQINADRIIDFSAKYHFTDSQSGQRIGAIKHKGMRSIWKATYLVFDETETQSHKIQEENTWIKIADALLSEIPVVGMFTGYMFHPKYIATDEVTNQPVMTLEKQPGFFEGLFSIEKLDANLDPVVEQRLLLAFLMMVQLERSRG